jgi:hypothetical protein
VTATTPVERPVNPEAAIDHAVMTVGNDFNGGSGLGKTVGTAAGIVVGCPVGAITGGSLTALASLGTLTPLGVVGGCLIGAGSLSLIGPLAGGAITGLPAAIGSAAVQIQHLHSERIVSAPLHVASQTAAVHATAAPAAPTGDVLSDANTAYGAAGPHISLAGGLGATVGGVVGVVGMAVGCPLGAVTGGAMTALLTAGTLTIPAAVAGCIAGSAMIGGLGAGAGSLLGAPVGLAVGMQKFNELQAQHH